MIELNLDFKTLLKDYIINNELYTPNRNSKYTLDRTLNVIEYVLKTGASWRSLKLDIFKELGIKWQSIYYHFDKFSKAKVFENVYLQLLDKYFKKNKSHKLKYLSIDSSFVKNQYASDVEYNGSYKKKKLAKLSLIVDSNGVPLSALIVKGNISDYRLAIKNFNDTFIEINSHTTNNKHKRYMLADSGYDSCTIRETIKGMGINPVIWYVQRNKNDIKKFNKREIAIYNKRSIVENTFSWIYQNRRTNMRYDRKRSNYLSFLFMAFIKIIIKR